MAAVDDLITENIDIWTSAVKRKASSGRGSGKKIELYGVKKLRELILDLAVRGLLVPQDPDGEPASVLLERIAAEKAGLVKAKKIKKQKPFPKFSDAETPHELPSGWSWAFMGSLSSDIHYGYTASAKQDSKGVRLLRITDIQNDRVSWETVPSCDITPAKASMYLLQDDDILIARTGGTIGKSYLVENISLEAVFASYLIRVKRISGMNAPYIKKFLGSGIYWKQLIESSAGTGQPNVNATALKSLFVPIPPLAEQHRIVAKVDELMALCDQLEQQTESSLTAHKTLVQTLLGALTQAAATQPNKAHATDAPMPFTQAWNRLAEHFDTVFTTEDSIEQLKQTILQLAVMGKLVPQDPSDEPASELLERIAAEKAELVKAKKIKKQKALPEIGEEEKPFVLPVGWEWSKVETLLLGDTQNGISKKANEEKDGTPLLRISAATARQDFIVDVSDYKLTTDVTQDQLEKYSLKAGDLLAVRFNGNKEYVGRTAVFPSEGAPNTVYPDKLIRMRFNEELTNSSLIRYFVNSRNIRKVIEHHCATTVGNWGISAKNLKTVPVPVPPILEQNRIVAKVDELMTLCDQLKAQLTDAQTTQLQLADAVTEQATH